MSTDRSDDDLYTSESPRLPRHILIANTCGIAALFMFLLIAIYFLLVAGGAFSEPPRGVVPLWTTATAVLGSVKITQWLTRAEACRTRREVADMRAYLETVVVPLMQQTTEVALRQTDNAGFWRGTVKTLRGEELDPDSTGEIGRVVRVDHETWRRNGSSSA